MPTQPAPQLTPYAPAISAPPAPALSMPATATPALPRASSNVALYVILGCLFLIALFLVVFFALRG
jgi:hypothetical protein